MHPPIFVRGLGAGGRAQPEAGLRSPSASRCAAATDRAVERRGAKAARDRAGLVLRAVQTVRDGIRAFNATGVARP
ncbi:MAG TPA: hypothetical protein VFG47_08030 [Geminicoccaceae bacterium]|nr:hypothetical protein [Geminicoccaceae bacterium]